MSDHPDGHRPRRDDHGSGDEADDLRAAADAEGLRGVDEDRVALLDGSVQYTVEAPVEPRPRDERAAVLALLGAGTAAVASVVAGLRGAVPLQGATLGLALLLISAAIGIVASRLLPRQLTLQRRRGHLEGPPAARAGAGQADRAVLSRRGLLGAGLAAVVATVAAALVPLRGLGPGADDALRRTAWGPGVRAVDIDGRPVLASSIPMAGVLTVFPEGHVDAADAQTLLVRIPPDVLSPGTSALGGGDGLLAYSKVCSHAGCPVGQLQIDDRPPATTYRLLCPCHQSLFDVTDGARPLSGPAPRPLAQLPIGTDPDGIVVATGDFPEPVGPGWWSR